MTRLHRRPLQEMVAQIVNGDHAPNDRLPREEDLAETFAVSRGVVREVIRGLEERGLVTVRHGVGAFVNDEQAWDTLDVDVLPAVLRGPDAVVMVREGIELLLLLEGRAVELAAERIDDTSAAALEHALRRLRAVVQDSLIGTFRPALADLHRLLLTAGRQHALGKIAFPIAAGLSAVDTPATLATLAPVVEAVLRREPVPARARLDEHLRALEARLLAR